MNREIKFRAWSESDKEMTPHERIRILPDETELHEVFEDNSVIWMQFTGLPDKNGVEVYEGDKIRYKNSKGYSTIVFENGAFGYYGVSCFITLLDSNMNYIEVIGNIHENSELLK